jgi:Fe-S oxidoreductase
MDLCLSCKGCKSECPSNVDVAKLKAEFLQHYYDANGVPFRARLIAGFSKISALGASMPGLYNSVVASSLFGKWIKQFSGFAQQRSMPLLHVTTLRKWYNQRKKNNNPANKKVYLFCDEFTNYNDTDIGIKAIELLEKLGYAVIIPAHKESGRAMLSKGLLRKAQLIANKNVYLLKDLITADTPLIGIEPSAILTFRDEYPDLITDELLEEARNLSKYVLLIDEFIAQEMDKGNIKSDVFTTQKRKVLLHGHCQQKALSNLAATSAKILSLPVNYTVETIPSGCCGMAGSFGYEKEHYDLSMKVAELVLLPAVRKQPNDTLIAAPGTSCRHQVKDGARRKAFHPVEILYDALLK